MLWEKCILKLFSGYLVSFLLGRELQGGIFGTKHTLGSHPKSLITSCASMGISLSIPEFELDQRFSNLSMSRGVYF